MTPTILDRLSDVRETSSGWTARCPAHDDQRSSLSVSIGDNERTLVHCHAGCTPEAIVSAAGLTMRDLAGPNGTGKPVKPHIVATYNYRDEQDQLAFQVVRYEPKDFKQRRPDQTGKRKWIWSTKGVRQLPYMLPQLLREPQRTVAVPEGERDCDNLARIGVLATCNAGGAGKWTAEHAKFLRGRNVVILPDNDQTGRQHANQVAETLQGIAASVRIVELPDLQPKEDVSDWIASGGTRDQLRELAKAAPLWTPAPQTSQVESDQPEADDEPPEFEPFPVEALPEPIRSYVVEAAAALGCDPSFVSVPILPALAAAVGNSRVIRLKRSWVEPLVVWSVTVGPSGTLKSPAWELAVRPLQQRQEINFRQYAEEMQQYERDVALHDADYARWKKSGRIKGEPPPCKPDEPHAVRFIASDTTVEALAVLLEQNSRGLLVGRDELSGWLNSFDAYKAARGADVAHWLSMHRAGPLTVDRKSGRRLIYVPKAAVSIAGTTQPEILALALGGRYEGEEDTREHFANGLAARLLMVYPPRIPKRWTDADLPVEIVQAVDDVFERLLSLDLPMDEHGRIQPVAIPLTVEAQRRFVEFYNDHSEEQVTLGPDLAAAWSKLEGYAARFALLVHLVRDAAGDRTLSDPAAVDLQSLDAGITLSRWFGDEAARIYATIGGTGDNADSRQARGRSRLVEWIRSQGGTVTSRDVMRSSRKYGTAEEAEEALQGLADAGVGVFDVSQPEHGPGRPVRRFTLTDAVDVDTNSGNPRKTAIVSTSAPSTCPESEVVSAAADDWEEFVV